MTSKKILVLDLGTNTGWALQDAAGIITSGNVSFKQNRFEGGGMVFLKFRRWLTEMKNNCGSNEIKDSKGTINKFGHTYDSSARINAVYFEEVRAHKGVNAAHKYGGFLGQLTAWCEHHEIAYQGIPVGTIKKHITGRGNASKEKVVEAVRKKGFAPKDDNEADAIALLDYVLNKYGIINN